MNITDDQSTERTCAHCGGPMEGKRPQAIHCGERCRDRARRQREREAKQANPRPRGNYPVTMPSRRKHKPGNVYGSLTLIERIESSANGDARALFHCECGNTKELQINNVVTGITANCADRANHPDTRGKAEVGYDGAHNRTKHQRGSASQYACHCGKQAEQWAYSHADHEQRADEVGREAGRPYSMIPEFYVPMCRSCHNRFDRARNRIGGNGLSLVHVAFWLATTDQPEEETQ